MTSTMPAVGAACVLLAVSAHAQSLGEAAKRAEEARKAAGGTTISFDMRDVDPSLARQELPRVRIDDAGWRRFLAADVVFGATLKSDPSLLQRFQALEVPTVRALERFIMREAPLMRALKEAAVEPREYASTHLAMLLAVQESGNAPAAVERLPAPVRENIAFVKTRAREIATLTTPSAKLTGKAEPSDVYVASSAPTMSARPVVAGAPRESRAEAAIPPAAGPISLDPGEELPDFRFVDFNGNTRNLRDFRGKYVMLDFWGSWCPPCRAEIPYLKDAYAQFRSRGFEVIGMDYEQDASLEEVRAYLNANGVTWTFAQPDSVRALITDRFRIRSFPTAVLLDPEGRVINPTGSLRGRALATTLDRLLPR